MAEKVHGARAARAVLCWTLLLFILSACPAAAGATPAVPGIAPAAAPAEEAAEGETDVEKQERLAREREEVVARAKDAADSTDQTILENVPATVKPVFGYRIFGISLWRYVVGAGVVCLALLAWFFFKRRFEARQKDKIPAVLGGWYLVMHIARLALKNPIKLLVIGFALKIVSWLIVTRYLPELVWTSNLLIYLSVIFYLYDLVALIDKYYGQSLFHSPDRLLDTVRPLVFMVARAMILLVAVMHVYESITGQTVVSIIAGLGLGGLALALASQETLKNLLGFASIALDQPFLVGDTVVIGSDEGTVEHVGMRSLRMRKYDGSGVVIPNAAAIAASVQNKTRRPHIRRNISLRLHPANGYEKVELALVAIREALEGHKGAIGEKPPVVRFEDYEPARLVINAYFWFDPDSGDDFYVESDRINREIYRRLSEAGVLFAER